MRVRCWRSECDLAGRGTNVETRFGRGLDCHEVIPDLWQGGAPMPGQLSSLDIIVLCAKEYQPKLAEFPGVKAVIHAPFDDAERLTSDEVRTAFDAARVVAHEHRRGRRVLVTCAQGRNRSGLVVALALRCLGRKPREAVSLVRRARLNALTNTTFVNIIEQAR
jgi:protein-tyrosine phosphatase